jgi:hypothetical protein
VSITPIAAAQVDLRQQEFVASIHAVINAGRTLTEQELLITPVTLSITQWAVIVMSCRQTTTAKELPAVAAPLVGHQAALAIATPYPSEVALEIAKVLAPGEGPASTDLRLAQLASSGEPSIDVILDPKTGLPARPRSA